MATIQIEIPDGVVPRALDAICKVYGYQATLEDGSPNPETRAAFAKRQLANWVKSAIKTLEAAKAGEEARAAKAAEIDGIAIT